MAPNDESGLYTSDGMYKNLNDGKYEKTIYVKTWTGRTITAVFSPEKVTKIVEREIEAKTGIPAEHQRLVVRGKVLTDNALLKDYGLSEEETIEMTAKLLGGMKHKSLSPKPMDTEREKRRKESEPCIDVGSLEDENPGMNNDEEPTDAKKWMRETMKDLKQRFERCVRPRKVYVYCAVGHGRSQGDLKQSYQLACKNDRGKRGARQEKRDARQETRRFDHEPLYEFS